MRFGVLTSGGDAPGMNAALRTVAVVGIARGHTVVGVRRGYEGLLEGDAVELDLAGVEGISRLGGTILGSARSALFPTPEGQARARARIAELGLEALVVIGGNGSLAGAHLMAADPSCRMVGLPASIDNDIGHTGLAIGVDTAVNTIVEACDRISDTARAHRRAFIVEVMGRHCGFLAMRSGIAAEADAILYGEDGQLSEDELVAQLEDVLRKCFDVGHKKRALIVKAEGVGISTATLCKRLQAFLDREIPGVDVRPTVLGHVVRGGNPSALDRVIAQRLAFGAVIACERGAHDVMLGWDVPGEHGAPTPDPHVRMVPLAEVMAESERLIDGSSPVVKARLALLREVQHILAL
ncbi:MAG TPA: 6-phosphofructokinase [Polyangiaceae bacterium]|nr:6-phosphofructokinase [Polyangiaceae bacterium]